MLVRRLGISFCDSCLPLLPLLNLNRLPVAFDLVGSIGLDVAEDVRMAVDELGGKTIENVVDGKRRLLLGHFRIEQNLQEEVAEFARKFGPVAIVDRLENFVGFFKRIRLDRVEGLFLVPGATAWGAEALHDGDRSLESFSCGGHRQPM